MRKIFLTVACMLAIACTNLYDQTEAEMKAWMEYMTPGEMHKLLAKAVDSWQGKISMWIKPNAQPMQSVETADFKMEMDGRYQIGNFTGNFMGMLFNGLGIVAFDNAKKFSSAHGLIIWAQGVMTLKGTYDAATKSLNMKGKMVDPTTGKDVNVREVMKFIDENTQIMEMYDPDPKTGKEYKFMEIVYTCKQA
ncbi:MAG: hypothetical protein C4308_06715 [Chitinophagaceae bacterium]